MQLQIFIYEEFNFEEKNNFVLVFEDEKSAIFYKFHAMNRYLEQEKDNSLYKDDITEAKTILNNKTPHYFFEYEVTALDLQRLERLFNKVFHDTTLRVSPQFITIPEEKLKPKESYFNILTHSIYKQFINIYSYFIMKQLPKPQQQKHTFTNNTNLFIPRC